MINEMRDNLTESQIALAKYRKYEGLIDAEITSGPSRPGYEPKTTKEVIDGMENHLSDAAAKLDFYSKWPAMAEYGEFNANELIDANPGMGLDAILTKHLLETFEAQYGVKPDAKGVAFMWPQYSDPEDRPPNAQMGSWMMHNPKYVRCMAVFKDPTQAMMWKLGAAQ